MSKLRIWNVAMGVLHAAQAVLVLVLANEFALPVTATFLEGPPGSGTPPLTNLFEIRVAWGVALFLLLSAVAHFVVSAPRIYPWYLANLERGRNYARWVEYSLSASVMIVLIAMLTGISDVAALGALFAVNAAMILFGLLMEHYESPGTASWLPFWFGVLAGAVPWALIAVQFWSPTSNASPPGFVYAIFISLFIFFNSFALNMAFQYRGVGRWSDYLFGERVYVLLSLTAKSALAWQVFAGTLAG